MKLTFRTKLLASHVGLVAAVVLVTTLALNRSLGTDLTERLDDRLERQARGAEEWVRRTRHPETLAMRLAGVVGAHVTIIDLDGRVLGDSEHPDVAMPPVPNQKGMPEVTAALEGRTGRCPTI